MTSVPNPSPLSTPGRSNRRTRDSASDAEGATGRAALEIVDVGGGGGSEVEEDTEDAALTEISMFPLRDHARATELALQKDQAAIACSRTTTCGFSPGSCSGHASTASDC